MAKLHSCNVLHLEAGTARLWHYSASGGQVSLTSERTLRPGEVLPAKVAARNLRSLWQHKLNIAWLPPQHVFLRVLQLPKCELAELVSMVEFQLEKLSPLPVAQIVWSLELVPHRSSLPSEQQTVVVVIAARQVVEEFLGRLESQSYQADRLEVPFLHLLLSTQIEGDGVWLYPHTGAGNSFCLAAWWYAGVLHNLSLIHLTAPDRWAVDLDDEMKKCAWGGELEGWLTAPPRWHLVADAATAEVWQPLLQPWNNQAVEVLPALEPPALAALNARRAAREEARADLLPAEYRARYQQQFIDRLWMRGLGALLAVYLAGVVVYMGAVEALRIQLHQVENQVKHLTADFKQVEELKARIAVQEQQIGLQHAALDSWKAASEVLPSELTLTTLTFSKGRTLSLQGTAPEGQGDKVTDYNEALSKFTIDGEKLFASVSPPNTRSQPGGRDGAASIAWSFTCELKGTETE